MKRKKERQEGKKYKGQTYYDLVITCENKPLVKNIKAYQNKIEKEKIWKDILESNYLDKRYLFYCKNYMGNYWLTDWKELNNSFSGRAKELKNHGSN